MCSLEKWFCGQISLGNGGLNITEGFFLTAQLLRAFGVCRDFAEAGFKMQRSHSYLTTGRVFPLSILLGLMFSGTRFEEV